MSASAFFQLSDDYYLSLPCFVTPDFTIDTAKRIGSGETGHVFSAQLRNSPVPVVAKIIEEKLDDEDAFQQINEEIRLQKKVSKLGLAPIIFYKKSCLVYKKVGRDYIQKPKLCAYCIVMERMGDSLKFYLKKNLFESTDHLLASMAEIARSLRTINRAGIAHLDCHLNNIMRNPKGGWSIIDYGLAMKAPANLQNLDAYIFFFAIVTELYRFKPRNVDLMEFQEGLNALFREFTPTKSDINFWATLPDDKKFISDYYNELIQDVQPILQSMPLLSRDYKRSLLDLENRR
jgi:serine/threonine protein kinase